MNPAKLVTMLQVVEQPDGLTLRVPGRPETVAHTSSASGRRPEAATMPISHLERENEEDLLRRIDQHTPAEMQARYDALIAQRRDETLSLKGQAELLRLTDEVEALDARRAEHLASLARLRGVSLSELMDSLGIRAPEYE